MILPMPLQSIGNCEGRVFKVSLVCIYCKGRYMRTVLVLVFVVSIAIASVMGQQANQGNHDISALIEKAEKGDVNAQMNLGNEYMMGQHTTRNVEEALKWYTRAAEHGSWVAQTQLFAIYSKGIESIRRDYVQAYMWLVLAGDQSLHDLSLSRSNKRAVVEKNREWITIKMTPDQIQESLRLAQKWKSTHAQRPPVSGGAKDRYTPPIPLLRPAPSYTEAARKAGVEGRISLGCMVRKNGMIDNCKILKGLGNGLDEASVEMVTTKWRFKPATYMGEPIDLNSYIEIDFRLPKPNK
jgi:TonB family protein